MVRDAAASKGLAIILAEGETHHLCANGAGLVVGEHGLLEAVLSVAEFLRGEFYLAPVEHAARELLLGVGRLGVARPVEQGAARRHRRREALDAGIGAKLSGDAQSGEADKALRHVAAVTDEVSENAKVDVEPVPGVVVVRDCKRAVAVLG